MRLVENPGDENPGHAGPFSSKLPGFLRSNCKHGTYGGAALVRGDFPA